MHGFLRMTVVKSPYRSFAGGGSRFGQTGDSAPLKINRWVGTGMPVRWLNDDFMAEGFEIGA
jgi:hypothetical protein